PLGFGVDGLAWAAVIAEWAGAIVAVTLILVPGFPGAPPLRKGLLFQPASLLRLGSMGRDLMIRSLLMLAAQFLFTRASTQQGATLFAANAILLNLHTLMGYAIDGFAHACQALVGAAVGARDLRALQLT